MVQLIRLNSMLEHFSCPGLKWTLDYNSSNMNLLMYLDLGERLTGPGSWVVDEGDSSSSWSLSDLLTGVTLWLEAKAAAAAAAAARW